MKYLKITILFIVFPIYISAQNVIDICKTHVEKLGGDKNVHNIENIYIEQTIYSNNGEIPQTTIVIPGKVYYQEVNFHSGKSIISVVDGKGWVINPYASTKPKDLSDKESANYIINSNIFGPLYDYYVNGGKSLVKSITLKGEEKIDRDDCFKLEVIYKSEFTVYVYISKKSFMIRKSENKFGSMSYSDYKKVNKVMFPFSVEVANAMGVMLGEVINLKTNIKIDYARFSKP